jgi:hypothetical protein
MTPIIGIPSNDSAEHFPKVAPNGFSSDRILVCRSGHYPEDWFADERFAGEFTQFRR